MMNNQRTLLQDNINNPEFHKTFGTSANAIRKILGQSEVYKFENLAELKAISMQFDNAKKFPVSVLHDLDYDLKNGEEYASIINIDRQEIACMTKSNYTIVQHQQIIDSAIEVFSALNMSIYGKVENMGGRIFVKAFFRDNPIKDDSDKGIHLGIRIGNSFDLSRGISVCLYAMRLVCVNQMNMSNLVARVVRKHVGEIDTTEMFKEAITLAVAQSEKFATYIEGAMIDSYEYEVLDKIMSNLFKVKKHKKEIMSRLAVLNNEKGQGNHLTRYDIYNCITNYATHYPLLTIAVKENMERISMKVLAKPLVVPEVGE